MDPRRIDQISDVGGTLVALCTDGTMWRLIVTGLGETWTQIKSVPQPEGANVSHG